MSAFDLPPLAPAPGDYPGLFGLKTEPTPGGQTPSGQTDALEKRQPQDGTGALLLCARCRQPITAPAEKIRIQERHRHVFANPGGYVFEIGCFKNAPGCAYLGEKNDEFTWFKGYQWQVAVCRNCLAHLGWLFAAAQTAFHGLILTALIPAAE